MCFLFLCFGKGRDSPYVFLFMNTIIIYEK